MQRVRRLPAAALHHVQRQQKISASQPLHRRVRGAQVHDLRRVGPDAVPLVHLGAALRPPPAKIRI